MICSGCKNQIENRREYCPHCGIRVEIKIEDLSKIAIKDAAGFHGVQLEYSLRWGILALGVVVVILMGLNDIWSKRLRYDGVDLPAIEAPAVTVKDSGILLGTPRFTRPVPVVERIHPKTLRYRRTPLKERLLTLNGGGLQTSKLIKKALGYLERKQKPDGSWEVSTLDLHHDVKRDESKRFQWARVGITGLATLAFLGEGSTWKRERKGEKLPHPALLKRALKFLVESQDLRNGRFGPAKGNFMYNHALATLAVTEAAALSGDRHLAAAAQKGVDLIVRIQGRRGGWGYRDEILAREDSSVSAWLVQALLAAKETGLTVEPEVIKKALKFYQDATDPKTGVVAYDFKDSIKRPALYGVALMLRLQMGEDPDNWEIKLLTKNMMEKKPSALKEWGYGWKASRSNINHRDRARTFDPYGWYFGTYGMFFKGGPEWTEWNTALIKSLTALQSGDGAWRGNDIWTVKMGAVYSTSMCVMSLQAYYRIQ